jgi:hypothetical protein
MCDLGEHLGLVLVDGLQDGDLVEESHILYDHQQEEVPIVVERLLRDLKQHLASLASEHVAHRRREPRLVIEHAIVGADHVHFVKELNMASRDTLLHLPSLLCHDSKELIAYSLALGIHRAVVDVLIIIFVVIVVLVHLLWNLLGS